MREVRKLGRGELGKVWEAVEGSVFGGCDGMSWWKCGWSKGYGRKWRDVRRMGEGGRGWQRDMQPKVTGE
jgi:hypothetical protein